MNERDQNLQSIFEELPTNINFIDMYLKSNNKLHGYHKPAISFSYLHYKSCHPLNTKNNIALSLARRIVRVVTDNKNNRLQKLKRSLTKEKTPRKNN